MVEGRGPDRFAAKRARFILALLDTGDVRTARKQSGMDNAGACHWVAAYNEQGWKGLLSIRAPRGGDFLARYDNGYWAERLVTTLLDTDNTNRAIPYGTSRSEPFTDAAMFREYALGEFALQAWSIDGRWKRPDLLSLPRSLLISERGNDLWSPDLQHWDNAQCDPYVRSSLAAVEVETSLWDVRKAVAAGVPLSFTVKDEDLDALKRWCRAAGKPLFIVQVFYDQAYILPFSTLLSLIDAGTIDTRVDDETNKATYFVPLSNGLLLGEIPTPDVEGRVFVAPNGSVTVYGRLVGSEIRPTGPALVGALMAGTLTA
jgi:hypothetical protein